MNSTQLVNVLEHLSKLQLKHNDDIEHSHDDHHHDDNDHEYSDDSNQLIVAKATAMTVLFCASTLCGSIPFLLNRWFKWTDSDTKTSPRSAIIIKCLLYFGGGVLLCTTFLHLLPEVKENITELQSQNIIKELNFHLAELLMCIGFFAMFFVEEIIHSYIHKQTKKNLEQMAFERGRSIQNSFLMRNNANNKKNCGETIETDCRLSVKDLIQNDIENQKYETKELHQENHHHNDKQMITKSPTLNDKIDSHHNHHQHSHHHHNHHHHHHHGHSHNIPIGIDEHTIVSSLRGLLVVLALSLHELFEGLAVGLESESKKVWYMFAAVSAHKLVLAFCVGVELLVTRTRLWLAIIYVITFAIVSPIGIGIGIAISNQNSATSAIPSAILQGLATGTLLYVVFFEILSKERSGFKAYLAFIVGFCVMFGLQFASGIQISELLICCGFFFVYILEELMQFIFKLKSTRNHNEFILQRTLMGCYQKLWKNSINNPSKNCCISSNGNRYKTKNINQQQNQQKNHNQSSNDNNIPPIECHFGIEPNLISMNVEETTSYNNNRRISLPMECPMSVNRSIGITNDGQKRKQKETMSIICLRNSTSASEFINPPDSMFSASSSSTLLLRDASPSLSQQRFSIDENNHDIQKRNNKNLNESNFGGGGGGAGTNSRDSTKRCHFKEPPIDNNDEFNSTITNIQLTFRSLITIFALSIHSIFEGLAVGLELNYSNLWYLFLAIGTHKFIIIFCIGIELVISKLKSITILIYIIGFSMVTPIGILIGAIISCNLDIRDPLQITNQISSHGIFLILTAFLQAISAGTLLYVIFFEILIKEKYHTHHHHFNNRNNDNNKNVNNVAHLNASSLIQCFAVGCGFMFMIAIQALLSGHEHTHSHGHSHEHNDPHDEHDRTAQNIEDQIKLLRAAAQDFVNK